jgi:tetratricopeptide (TPR) repeat protein/tRNA A-37 threonylcarbamoyl transferase component Bud32
MQEQSLFIEAQEREDPAQRAAFLDQACAGDPALRQRIERLLKRHVQDRSFLESPTPSLDAFLETPITEWLGAVIGPYKLLEQIGEGGFGVVFLAEQQQPVRRKVALKVLKPGMDTKQVVARFEAERQALALMDHLNIAHVFDGGETSTDRPYFVMELVKGVPITDYCDQSQLTPRDRLELFVPVCQAVQHAHQKGIIHRDIKSCNLLVDPAGHLWVTDFGLARMPWDANLTMAGDLVGTVRYMSPEQTLGQRGLIDHRTDVYSLGVTLYELATLEPAFSGHDRQDILRQITTDEPRTPRRVNPAVPVELETILLKAIDKAPADRYQSAQKFADDLARFLKDEPIRGRRPTVLHQLRKWTRRNWGVVCTGLIAAAVLLVTLAVGSTVAAFRLNEAWKAADDNAGELLRHVAQKEDELARLNEASCLIQNSRSSIDKLMLREAYADLNRAVALRPDLPLTWFARGDFLMRVGLWDLAATDYAAAFRLQEPTTPRHWACFLMLSRFVGDDAAHAQFARRLPRRFPPGLPYTKYDNELVRTCALATVPDQDLDWLLKIADKTLAHELVSWNRTAKALALYRAGEFEQATAIVEHVLYYDHEWSKFANCYLVLALAQNRLGKTEGARLALAAAERILEKGRAWQEKAAVGATPSYWFDWLEGEILYREAKQDIEARKPPDDPRAWYLRGRAFALLGKNQEAADSYRRARELAKGRTESLPAEVWPVRSIRIRGLRPKEAPPAKNPMNQSGS